MDRFLGNKKEELKIEVIAIGSELLTPYYQDTNSLYLTQKLNDLGLNVQLKTIVGDNWADLALCIDEAIKRADMVIATGGLGPTQDDRTMEAFASVLRKNLVFQEDIWKHIQKRFRQRKIFLPSVNKKQAYVPEGAEILFNPQGTAPGIWLEAGSKLIILLPGPPRELIPMFEAEALPRLEKFRKRHQFRKILKATDLTESKVESLISDLYPEEKTLNLTVLAYPGQIELHLTGQSMKSLSEARERVLSLKEQLCERLQDYIFSSSGENLEQIVGKLLSARKATLAVAESCTGGLLGHRLTNVPGSSQYFLMGVQAYSNKAKTMFLNVSEELIEKEGAVSPQVAEAMASGVRERISADYGLAITGIAGPSGGSVEKPVGLVYTALSWEKGAEVHKNYFAGGRETIKSLSTQKALNILRQFLIKQDKTSIDN